jgi:hypothetical protein
MSRVGIVMIAVFLSSSFSSSAFAVDCQANIPSKRGGHWSYRIIDGRKCWYSGKPMMSKSLLRWPAKAQPVSREAPNPREAPPVARVAQQPASRELQPVSQELTGSIVVDQFEARWRKLAPEVKWLVPTAMWPMAQWPLAR